VADALLSVTLSELGCSDIVLFIYDDTAAAVATAYREFTLIKHHDQRKNQRQGPEVLFSLFAYRRCRSTHSLKYLRTHLLAASASEDSV